MTVYDSAQPAAQAQQHQLQHQNMPSPGQEGIKRSSVPQLRTSDLSGSLGDSFNPDPRGVHVFSLCLKTDLTFHVGGEAQLDIRLPFDPWDDRLSPGKERLKLHMISVRMANISVMRHVCICLPCSCRLVARRRCFAA